MLGDGLLGDVDLLGDLADRARGCPDQPQDLLAARFGEGLQDVLAADPDTAWRVLGDLAAVDRWIPGITKVELDGMTRVCTFADGHTWHEAILDYSPAARSYRYTIDGGLPVSDNRGRFVVEPAGNGARIVWESSFVASTRLPKPRSAGCGPECCRP